MTNRNRLTIYLYLNIDYLEDILNLLLLNKNIQGFCQDMANFMGNCNILNHIFIVACPMIMKSNVSINIHNSNLNVVSKFIVVFYHTAYISQNIEVNIKKK